MEYWQSLKNWWCPPKKPVEVHLLDGGRRGASPLPLDPREVVHDKPPTLNDLTKIIYFYKTPKLKQ